MTIASSIIIAIIVGYLIGSIPFGLLLTQLAGLGDIRKIGSGNIGATNVLRTGRRGLAALTLLLDALKGAVAVWLGLGWIPEQAVLVGLAALVGHIFPVWLNFQGGKGVATAAGMLLALSWPVGCGVVAVWLATALVTRYSSLAALVAAATAPIWAFVFDERDLIAPLILCALLIWGRHGTNLRRLLSGTESKISFAKKTS